MEMDEATQRTFIRFLAQEVKVYCRELLVYQFVVHMLEERGATGIDTLVEIARNSEAVKKRWEKHFEGFDELLPPSEEEILDQRVVELLERWKPSGEPN